MNSGSFFRLDLETSKVVNGITIFNYIDLPELDSSKEMLRYPIRLSISSDSISFFVHYFNDGNTPRHTEEVILNLPLVSDDKTALSSTIKRIYNTSFPLSSYLYNLLKKRYVDIDDKSSNYLSFQNSQINKDSYSSLYIWGLLKSREHCSDDSFHYEIGYKDNKSPYKITKFLRKLLLDFIFDLMHSDVFECSKYYSNMRRCLMNDFFFSAIVKKSEYYYNRRLIRHRFESNLKKDDVKNHIKKLYAEKLDEAEREWVDVIMNPLADKYFVLTPEWYEDLEEPYKKANTPKKDDSFELVESWFVNPEEEMSRIVFPLKGTNIGENASNNMIHYLNSFELCCYIEGKTNSSVSSRITQVSKWFYRRFNFSDTFRLHLFDDVNMIFYPVLCFFILYSLFVPCIWESPKNFIIFPLFCCISLLVTSCSLGCKIWKLKDSRRLDDILLCNRRTRELKKAIIWSGILFLPLLGLYFYGSIPHIISYGAFLFLLGLFLLGLLFIFRKRIRTIPIVDNIHLLLPRLVASIATAWIMIVIGNDIVKEHLSIPIIIIITIIVFVFVLYENNKVLPNHSPIQIFKRSASLLAISLSISVIVGIFAIDIISSTISNDKSKCCVVPPCSYSWSFIDNCDVFTLTIFPEYLIPFSFLAMFIGVFIQMIFEEKGITEM